MTIFIFYHIFLLPFSFSATFSHFNFHFLSHFHVTIFIFCHIFLLPFSCSVTFHVTIFIFCHIFPLLFSFSVTFSHYHFYFSEHFLDTIIDFCGSRFLHCSMSVPDSIGCPVPSRSIQSYPVILCLIPSHPNS